MCSELINKDIQKTESFKAQGWTNLDIKLLNFRAYQYLVGEFESRYIQQTVKLTPDLVDYFIPYTSETINPKEVNVYGSDIKFYTDKSYQYGIELTADNKYILHTKKDKYVPQMFLHELGHIIFDFIKDKYLDEIEYGYDSKSGIGTEEYFCESFVDYVVRTEIDKELSDTIKQNYTVKDYDKYDAIFYDFFLSQEYQIDEDRLGDMLLFVNKIIELVW